MKLAKLALVSLLPILAACGDKMSETPIPSPITLTQEAAGHYCQMVILDHAGPKAQMFVADLLHPLWFSQVRDGLAKVKSEERSSEILVLYVNDMGAAESWEQPGADNWIQADSAYFVVGSDAVGGMGAPEYVPFADKNQAEQFVAERGGEIIRFSDISAEAVLAPIEVAAPSQNDLIDG